MTMDQKQAIGLFRYGVISPLETGTTACRSHNEFFRSASKLTYNGPDGKPTHVSPSTIEKWHRAYQKGGFEALLPQGRSDEGASRKLPVEVQNQVIFLIEQHPFITAADVYRKLLQEGVLGIGEVSQSTVERFVRNVRTSCAGAIQIKNKDMHRYEREHINEVWYGDTCYGPYINTKSGKKRVYFMAVISDASRFVGGAAAFFNDNVVKFMTVLRSAVSKYGRPRLMQLDNGSTYHNNQMELLAARIGSAVHYCEPYTPTSKAKVERMFLTLRMQFLATLDMREIPDLETMRQRFLEYIHNYNQKVHSSLAGKTPEERFFSEPEQIRRLTQDQIDKSFLLEMERRVSADSVVVINNTEYEVNCCYAKQKIRLRYSPDMKTVYVVESNGDLTPIRLLDKHDNAVIKRERIKLSDGGVS